MADMYPSQPPAPGEPAPQPPPEPVRHEHGNRTPWVGGVVLILIGLVFLLRNFGFAELNNWWALFILIPAIGSLASAWNIYQRNGRMSSAVSGPLIGGFILLMVAVTFLLNLNWGMIWPAILIIVGVGALLSGFGRD